MGKLGEIDANKSGHRRVVSHEEVKHFQCPICRKGFRSMAALRLHIEEKHTEKQELSLSELFAKKQQ